MEVRETGVVKTTVSLDPDVHRAVVDHALELGRERGKVVKFSTALNEILRKALQVAGGTEGLEDVEE